MSFERTHTIYIYFDIARILWTLKFTDLGKHKKYLKFHYVVQDIKVGSISMLFVGRFDVWRWDKKKNVPCLHYDPI